MKPVILHLALCSIAVAPKSEKSGTFQEDCDHLITSAFTYIEEVM